jgi:hypothetical protein
MSDSVSSAAPATVARAPANAVMPMPNTISSIQHPPPVLMAPEYEFKTFLVQLTVVYDLIKGFEKLRRYRNETLKFG